MNEIFSYNTVKVRLNRSTRSLHLTFRRNQENLTLETLFELESIFAWCASKTEIQSILMDSENAFFSEGIDKDRLSEFSSKKIQKITEKLQLIVHAMYHLPQTIIADLGGGSMDIATELALGADIRISHQDAIIAFNHTRVGLVPSSGGIGLLSSIVGQSRARSWLLTGKEICQTQQLNSGLIHVSYDESERQEVIQDMLKSIHQCSSVSRIQTKLGLLERLRPQLERSRQYEKKVSQAALITQDWKEDCFEDFMPAKHMATSVKLSLIKSHEGHD